MTRFTTTVALLTALSPMACTAVDGDFAEDLADDEIETQMRIGGTPQIQAVYFGQHHLQTPDHAEFRLVGDREALVKAYVFGDGYSLATPVIATLTLDGASTEIQLSGPAAFPLTANLADGSIDHDQNNAFTGTIPAQWVAPGLQVSVRVEGIDYGWGGDGGGGDWGGGGGDWGGGGGVVPVYDEVTHALEVGAPTDVELMMVDVHFFGSAPDDYQAGWLGELEQKWPVSDLTLSRTSVIFDELVVVPRAGAPATLASSTADYQAKAGVSFDGEQATALQWVAALRKAGGQSRRRLSYVNILGVEAGGQAWGFQGVGGIHEGVLAHELGHAMNVLHLVDEPGYPYVGDVFGIEARTGNDYHVGPTWGLDLRGGIDYIPPTVQFNSVANDPSIIGKGKLDPMQGGGTGDQEQGDIFRMYSDWTARQMQDYLEDQVVVWNASLGSYASWDDDAGDYTATVAGNGVNLPIVDDVDVISIMAAVSAPTPAANHVYPPIGPYRSGLIQHFDPTVAADRAAATANYCPAAGCDVTLRVTQGGVESLYMLPTPWKPGMDPLNKNSLKVGAVNVPASDGAVTSVELLLTTNANTGGMPANPTVLASWTP